MECSSSASEGHPQAPVVTQQQQLWQQEMWIMECSSSASEGHPQASVVTQQRQQETTNVTIVGAQGSLTCPNGVCTGVLTPHAPVG